MGNKYFPKKMALSANPKDSYKGDSHSDLMPIFSHLIHHFCGNGFAASGS